MAHSKGTKPQPTLLLAPGLAAVCLAALMSTGGLGAVDSKLEQQVTEQASLQRRPPPDEPDEAFPGGTATTDESIDTHDAFSHFSRGIGFEGEARFKVGNAIFRKLWVSAPSSTQGSDGLGPLYNSRSCQSCHLKDGRGHPPNGNFPQDTAESMFLRLSIPPETDEQRRLIAEHKVNSIDEPTYGAQLQETAVQGHDNEGHMHITYEEVPIKLGNGSTVSLRRPTYSIADLKYGPLHPMTMLSPRVAPPMIGLGLIEAIPEEQIRAHADPDDKDGDGISGRANEVWSIVDNRLELGRFGWKAGVPSIRQQTGTAFAIDIGISNPVVLKPSGDCTPAQTFCLNAPNGNSARDGGVEVGAKLFDLVVFYAQNLAVPPRRDFHRCEGRRGQGAVLCTELPGLPHALVHHRQGGGPAPAQQPEDLALLRPVAARHGRGPRRQPPRRHGGRARVAHPAAVGPWPHADRQRPHAVPARRARAQSRGSHPLARG